MASSEAELSLRRSIDQQPSGSKWVSQIAGVFRGRRTPSQKPAESVLEATTPDRIIGLEESRESLVSPEKKVTGVRTVTERDFPEIFSWWSDEATRKHLDPSPPYPKDDSSKELVRASLDFQRYLFNDGEPHKLLAIVAVNRNDTPLAFAAARMRGRLEEIRYSGGSDITRVPFLEKVTTNPKLQVGQQLDAKGRDTGVHFHAGAAAVFSLADHIYNVGYSPRKNGPKVPQKASRIWIMVDVDKPPILFWENKAHYKKLPGDYNAWKAAQGIATDRGNAYKYEQTAEEWAQLKRRGEIDTSLIFPITTESDMFSNGTSALIRLKE